MTPFADSDIKYLKGIGEKLGNLLKKDMEIGTFRDLLYTFPYRYVDRSRFYRISEFVGEMPHVQVKGYFLRFLREGEGARKRLIGLFSDGLRNMEVAWFSQIDRIANSLVPGKNYVLFGKPTLYRNTWQMSHPEIEDAEKHNPEHPFLALYSISDKARKKGIVQRSMRRWVQNVLTHQHFYQLPETLPSSLIEKLRLMPLQQALRAMHFPASTIELQQARRRMKFEELFYIQLHILRFSRQRNHDIKGQIFPRVGPLFNRFYKEIIPFEPTDAQKKVLRQIHADLITGRQMNRLLQGDVGSGKTLVAFMAALLAVDNNAQAAIMAPTEILATQHYESLHPWCRDLGINIALLTGSTPQSQRRYLHQALLDGSLNIIVGTHALIEDKVQFANLGLAIIDEQHRFGVAQRARMWQKNSLAPHMLVMTATPIPRTLAMTLYGDLDVSVIDQLPPGRKPVGTALFTQEDKNGVWKLVASQLRQGRQAYIVYPLIKENEKINLRSLEEGFRAVHEIFGQQYRIAYVHGQMKPAEKDYQMNLFASGEAAILVATTVIEVGVNVPNATVMVIENAERFGLSQLHQLRGRVGRGADMSYCALVSKEKIGADTRRRLEIMTSTTDGFEIAEADMKLRGPGDIEGTIQSGMPYNLKVASLAADADILTVARRCASEILDAYPVLSNKETATAPDSDQNYYKQRTDLQILNSELKFRFGKSVDWSAIS